MTSVPVPPPIRELRPVQFFKDGDRLGITDFGPRPLPADSAEERVTGPKGAAADSSNSEETLQPELSFDPETSPETLHQIRQEMGTESLLPNPDPQSAQSAAIPSLPSSSPTGSPQALTGLNVPPAIVPSTK